MGFKIASFNMYKFNYRSDKEVKKDIDTIANIIVNENFDIVAMQEVLNRSAAKSVSEFCNRISPYKWDCAWAQPISRSIQAAEGYAYIWNTSKFRFATEKTREEIGRPDSELSSDAQGVSEPRIHNNYKKMPFLTRGKLARDPYYVRFESTNNNSWFEIRLINTHIMFAEASSEESVSVSDSLKRLQEFEALCDIYRQLSDHQYRSCRPSYTFLLGDYNLSLPRAWTKAPYLPEIFPVWDKGEIVKEIITIQDRLTTLKTKPQIQGQPVRGYANNYDHFSYDKIRFDNSGITLRPRAIDTVRKYCVDDFERHRKEVSDHIPICLSISLREET